MKEIDVNSSALGNQMRFCSLINIERSIFEWQEKDSFSALKSIKIQCHLF